MQVGDVLNGRYEIEANLGHGGAAEVFRARDPLMQREVAVKAFSRTLLDSTSTAMQYATELAMLGALEHPHILPIYDTGVAGKIPYIVMRYADRGTLHDELAQGRPLLKRVSFVINQIARALEYAHRHDMIHRDVKPHNILIEESGDAYLGDFSLAILVAHQHGDTLKLTSGTAHYMSPEQAAGEQLTPATDVYSLAATLYEMLTLHHPYEGKNWAAITMKVLTEPPEPLLTYRADLGGDIADVLAKGLARNPQDRYASPLHFIEAYETTLARSDISFA